MDITQHKQLVRDFTRIFKNEHNVEGVDHLFHPDFNHNFRQDLLPGLEGFKQIGRVMNSSFPDVHVTQLDLIASGNKVVEHSSARGTHLGDLIGVKATGKEIHWTEIHIYRIKDGQIIEHWVEWSDTELMAQITGA